MGVKGLSRSARWVVASVGMVAALAVLPTGASSHPGEDHVGQSAGEGLGVRINSPADLAGFHEAVQWGATGKVDSQTADLVYAGTGCSPANYAAIADKIRGKIALVDSKVGESATDLCPRYTFAQKVQSAEKAGAIGFVQIPAVDSEGKPEDPRGNATALIADIPALEVHRTADTLAARKAVIGGTEVNVTLEPPPPPPSMERLSDIPCTDGMAGPFECDGIDLTGFVPAEEFNGAGQSDIWGWTDPENGDEYVILGKTNGVAFFRVTDAKNPVYLGELPNRAVLHRVWHDMKVYENHAFIVSESEPHGMTVFDLTRLRGVTEPREWDQDAFYRLHSAAHNIAINEDTGFAYIVGGNNGLVVPDQCLSGLHMVDIRKPKEPVFAGCYFAEGGPGTAARSVGAPVTDLSPAAYVHDTECVVYGGPDSRFEGREICFNAAEDKLVIADVTDKLNPVTLGVTDYPKVAYAHQGSLTEDHKFLLLNDELDETTHKINTRTMVLDVRDLKDPKVHFQHLHETKSIDHNNYVHEGLAYQSNYTSGLQVLDTADIDDADNPRLKRRAFFDTYPAHSDATFDGTWSNYPFFESGTIAVSGRAEGLFLLRMQRGVEATCDNCPVEIRAGRDGTAKVTVANTGSLDDAYRLKLEGVPEGWAASVEPQRLAVGARADRQAAITIDVPPSAKAGTYTFKLNATSVDDSKVSTSEEIEVTVVKGSPFAVAGQ